MRIRKRILVPYQEECLTSDFLISSGWIFCENSPRRLQKVQPSSGQIVIELQAAQKKTSLHEFVVRENAHLHYLTLPQAKFAFVETEDKTEGEEFLFFTKSDVYFLTMARARIKSGNKVAFQLISPPSFIEEGQSFLYKHPSPRRP